MSDACSLLKDPDVCSSISTDEAIQLCYTFKVNYILLLSYPNIVDVTYSFCMQITKVRLDALNDEYDKDHGRIDMGLPVVT
jgi:hypothetical protein